MSDTSYIDGISLITADSMNDFNRLHYTIFGDPADVQAARASVFVNTPGMVSGLTYANSPGDLTNDIDIATGYAVDGTSAKLLRLTSAITKRLDAAWAVGTNQGGLDTGAIGNTDYYIWLIMRSDTGVVDALFSLSSTAPTMPTSYDYKRLIGWFKRVGATIVPFHTYETHGGGVELAWDAPTLDVNLTNTLTTTRRTDAVKVPQNFSTVAHLLVQALDAGTGYITITCPDVTDAASSGFYSNANIVASVSQAGYDMHIRTSSTGTIAARSNVATVDQYSIVTMGFDWARRV